jgi:hypothetical protein
VFIFLGVVSPKQTHLEVLGAGELCIYSRETVSNSRITETVDLGYSNIYKCQSYAAATVRAAFHSPDGESITLDGGRSERKILNKLGGRIVSRETVAGMSIIYAYTPKSPKFLIVGGQKINIQIVAKPHQTIVGMPIVLGAY